MNMKSEELSKPSGLLGERSAIKAGPKENHAYAGVPQSDSLETLSGLGEMSLEEMANAALAGYLSGIFSAAKSHRETNGIDDMLTQSLRSFKAQYDHNQLREIISRGFQPVFFPLAAHKANTAIAWIDEFFTNGEHLVSIKPTPKPETQDDISKLTLSKTLNDMADEIDKTGAMPPPELIQSYAEKMRPMVERSVKFDLEEKAERMERQIKDDMIQGRWSEKIHDLITYICVYGCGGFRSPIIKRIKDRVYKNGKITVEDRIVREFEAVSPFDLFPSPGMVDTQHGNLCVRVRYYPIDLIGYRGMPCWLDDAIDSVVSIYGESGLSLEISSDSAKDHLTNQNDNLGSKKNVIEGFEFWGQVSGSKLANIGIEKTPEGKKIEDSDIAWYEVNAIVFGGKVVYCRVMEEAEDRPIDVVKFYDTPEEFFGRGPLNLIESNQRICNAAGRALVTNMGYASGPQGVIDLSAIDPSDDKIIRPFKMWAARTSATNPNATPVRFFSIDSHSQELSKVFEFFQRLADEISGIPAFANGTDAAVGAARTATGLNMLFGAANRGIKKVVGNIDEGVKKSIRRLYWWHMKNNPDDSIKGDLHIEVNGLKYFASKTQESAERLNLYRALSQDPAMAQLISPERRARIANKIGIGFGFDTGDLAPTDDELEIMREEAERQQQIQMMQAQQMQMQQAQARAMANGQGGGAEMQGQPPQGGQQAVDGSMLSATGRPPQPQMQGAM